MTNSEKIFCYLQNEMTDTERIHFETELKSDPELNQLYEDYSEVMKIINSAKNPQLADKQYFVNLVPRIRERIDSSAKPLVSQKLGLIYSLILLVLMGYFLFINDSDEQGRSDLALYQISESDDESELNSILNYLNDEAMIYDYPADLLEVNIDEIVNTLPEVNSRFWDEFGIADFSAEISVSEAELIYNDLALINF